MSTDILSTQKTKMTEVFVQNSGVMVEAESMHFSSSKDKNPVVASMAYYGVIEEIWEINYSKFKVALLKCKWVSNNAVVIDPKFGFVRVDLQRLGHRDEPFILASQAKQVFYVTDPANKRMSIVLQSKKQKYGEDSFQPPEVHISRPSPPPEVVIGGPSHTAEVHISEPSHTPEVHISEPSHTPQGGIACTLYLDDLHRWIVADGLVYPEQDKHHNKQIPENQRRVTVTSVREGEEETAVPIDDEEVTTLAPPSHGSSFGQLILLRCGRHCDGRKYIAIECELFPD
ncbi:hypothetical protein K1719_008931 [Acacia pycnantha]|nr:hypothetical protein K1719_008931 [Acacia pycnantha]